VIHVEIVPDSEDRARSCTGKQRYGREATARRSAERYGEKKGERFEAYPCDYCGGWHIGHAGNVMVGAILRVVGWLARRTTKEGR
jgi:hypothetical protein